jgi:hypothetical protein
MAVTQSQTNGGVQNNHVAVGRYITSSTAAAIAITCGFKPRFVRVMNVTSLDKMEWYEGMTAAHAVKQVAAGTSTEISSNGITVAEDGFTIGLDTDVNVINEQLSWIAIG